MSNKKRIVKLLFLIVFLITLVIGFSYAFSNWNYIGSTFNKLTSSDLEISLLESNFEELLIEFISFSLFPSI